MTKQLWFKCLKSIVLSTIASLGAFMVCGLVIAAALNSIKNDAIQDLAIKAIIMIVYAIFLYIFRMRNRLDTYAEHTNKFDPKKELIAYVKTEGKTMFIFYEKGYQYLVVSRGNACRKLPPCQGRGL